MRLEKLQGGYEIFLTILSWIQNCTWRTRSTNRVYNASTPGQSKLYHAHLENWAEFPHPEIQFFVKIWQAPEENLDWRTLHLTPVGTCIMNSVDISDVHRNFPIEKLRAVGTHFIIYNRRKYNNCCEGGGQGAHGHGGSQYCHRVWQQTTWECDIL